MRVFYISVYAAHTDRKSQDEYTMCLAVTVSKQTVPVASAFISWERMSDYTKVGGDSPRALQTRTV